MTGNIDPALFGMPDANTAGVQAGVTLTKYTGPMTITQPGTVIENVIISGTLTIAADNVTIRNCVIQDFDNWGILADGVNNTRVEYCDIDGSGSTRTSGLGMGGGTNSAIIGCDISGMVIGIQLFGRAEVKDNYIHDLADTSKNIDDRHFDGITLFGGQNGSVIEHNTISMPTGAGGTAAVFIKTEFGAIDGVVVKGNLMTGDPSYTVYVESTTRPITNVTIQDNYVERGIYGYYNVKNSTPIISGNVEWNNNTDPTPYPTSAPTTPATPTIASFSTDSGVAGDKITSDNTLTLTGKAVAGSTVKVYDGSTQIGTTTANSSGAWTYTTAALSDAAHTLKVTATTSSGQTSAASAALTITIDTKAPVAPTIASNAVNKTNQVVLSGNAEANSTIKVYDGTTEVGTATTNSSGAWSLTTSVLSVGTHALTAKATDAAGNVSGASSAVNPVIASGSSGSVAAPTIASFSTDSGVAGDRITNDNTLTLTGTAAANSTVKVFDGTTQVGTATANSSGQWTLTTSTLTDGGHNLTATATNASGQASAASTALSVTIDTKAPVVPTMEVYSQASAALASAATLDKFILRGTAEANSTVKVFDGAKQIGTATANSSGGWSFDPGELSKGSHSFSAIATDVAGNASTASAVKSVNVSGAGVAAPVIASFSKDSGIVGDKITNDNTLTLTGTAVANGTVKVFDGSTQVGTATANSSGQWTLTTPTLKDGGHNLTATATDTSGATSAASTVLSVTIDTKAPSAPTLGVYSQTGAAIASTANLDKFVLKGTAEANSTVKVFDGAKQIGTATANSNGAWSFDTGQLNKGAHSFTATATDAAGNASAASVAKGVSVAGLSTIEFTSLSDQWIYTTIKGTADPNSQIKLYDGKTAIGQVTADSNGAWTFQTKGLSDTIHTFTAQGVDSAGKVVATSAGQAILGSSKGNTLTGTSGDDYFFGNGHPDTFVFSPNFGNDVIKDFAATGWKHDTIKFSSSVFDSFASVLSHASQVGQDVVIASGQDTLTLKNVKLSSLNSHDFQFA